MKGISFGIVTLLCFVLLASLQSAESWKPLGLNSSNTARFFLAVGGGTAWVEVSSNQALVESSWYHLVGTYDGGRSP